MLPRWGTVLVLLALPSLVRAQEAPEQLLPAGTQIYFRWDGIDAHRTAYARTALGKLLVGDTGKFLAGVVSQLQEAAASLLTNQQVLQGVPPDRLQQIQADLANAPKLLNLLGRQGLLVGVEVRGLEPPAAELLLIVPNAGSEPGPLFGTLRLLSSLLKVEVKEARLAGRAVHHLTAGPVHVAWWTEGKHALVVAGTDGPEAVLKRLRSPGARLAANPLYRQVQGFNGFETGARAYIDLAALVRLARARGKEVTALLTDLGLDQLQSWTFYSGFDGDAERTVAELALAGPRKGLFRLAAGKPFQLGDLPLLPPDAVSWSALNFDAAAFYDVGLQAAERITAIIAPDQVPRVKKAVQLADALLGINLRQDLLGALGDRFVQYTSPAEGLFFFGQTVVFKVKDAEKLQAALAQAIKALARLAGADVSLKKPTYRGVVLNEVHIRQQGFFLLPTYAVHKDWLVVSLFPQPVQGYILRATGELPAWKPDPHVQKALAELPRQFLSISVSDPRPGLQQLLAVAPLIGGIIRSVAPDARFAVESIPNAHEVTRHLFPNVSVVSDDGRALRSETRASLLLPLGLGSSDPSWFFLAAAVLPRIALGSR